jgi:hypothetical protein
MVDAMLRGSQPDVKGKKKPAAMEAAGFFVQEFFGNLPHNDGLALL